MTHTTSTVFFDRLQREHLDVGHIASVFKRKQRVDDTDGDGAIQKSVRALKFLGLRVRSLHLLCKVHVAAGDRDDITAQIPALKTVFTHCTYACGFRPIASNLEKLSEVCCIGGKISSETVGRLRNRTMGTECD